MTPDDHEVDRHDLQQDLTIDRVTSAASDGRADQPLEHTEAGLDLPALAVGLTREVLVQLAAVVAVDGIRRPVASSSAATCAGNNRVDVEFFAAPSVGGFGFVSGVGQQRADPLAGECFGDGLSELAVIERRSARDDGRQEQMRLGVADGRELWIAVFVVSAVAAAVLGVIGRDVSRLQAGRVDGRLGRRRVDQSALAGEANCCIKDSASAPLFSSRASA